VAKYVNNEPHSWWTGESGYSTNIPRGGEYRVGRHRLVVLDPWGENITTDCVFEFNSPDYVRVTADWLVVANEDYTSEPQVLGTVHHNGGTVLDLMFYLAGEKWEEPSVPVPLPSHPDQDEVH